MQNEESSDELHINSHAMALFQCAGCGLKMVEYQQVIMANSLFHIFNLSTLNDRPAGKKKPIYMAKGESFILDL